MAGNRRQFFRNGDLEQWKQQIEQFGPGGE
jgi:hypothetical protein